MDGKDYGFILRLNVVDPLPNAVLREHAAYPAQKAAKGQNVSEPWSQARCMPCRAGGPGPDNDATIFHMGGEQGATCAPVSFG
jgi:hypothetical protein